jgi:hypothetical protein
MPNWYLDYVVIAFYTQYIFFKHRLTNVIIITTTDTDNKYELLLKKENMQI